MSKYKLYCGGIQAIPKEIEFSFYDGNEMRIYLLSTDKPSGEFEEMEKSAFADMPREAQEWFVQSKLTIIRRDIKQNPTDYVKMINEFTDRLDAEIEKITKKGLLKDGKEE